MKLKDWGGEQQDILAMIRRSKARYFAKAQNWMADQADVLTQEFEGLLIHLQRKV